MFGDVRVVEASIQSIVMRNQKKIRNFFDNLAPIYGKNFVGDKSGKSYEFNKRKDIVAKVTSGHTGELLDCASGTGEITAEVLKEGNYESAVVCDLSGRMLSYARKNIEIAIPHTEVTYAEADIFVYSSECNAKFDIILCLGLVAHVGQLGGLLRRLYSILKPGGVVVLQSSLSQHWGLKLVRLLSSKKWKKKNGYELSFYSTKEINDIASQSGFRIVGSYRYCIGFPYGDHLSKYGNYCLEVALEKIASRMGSECIFVLAQ